MYFTAQCRLALALSVSAVVSANDDTLELDAPSPSFTEPLLMDSHVRKGAGAECVAYHRDDPHVARTAALPQNQ